VRLALYATTSNRNYFTSHSIMARVHLVHGFFVRDGGSRTVAKLAPYFESVGMESTVFSYGWIGPMGVWFLNPRIVKQLIPRVKPGDIGVGHSNGCVLLHMSSVYGAPFRQLVYLNPALSSNAPVVPPHVKRIHVWHAHSDLIVKFAAWLRALVPWAPIGDPLWGDMGARGYKPGNYENGNYEPKVGVSSVIHKINMACTRRPTLLWLLRITIGVPFAFLYCSVAAPVEVMLTYYFNNVVGRELDMALTLRRSEDRNFILVALLVPVLCWIMFFFLI